MIPFELFSIEFTDLQIFFLQQNKSPKCSSENVKQSFEYFLSLTSPIYSIDVDSIEYYLFKILFYSY